MSSYADRLAALRQQLKDDRLDGFVVPLTDEHMSEYVGSYAQRLAWLTGFKGSAGSAVVLPEEAAIFTDGRYTIQVRQQVSPTEWSYQSVPETSISQVAEGACAGGARIGYDPWLHTADWVKQATAQLAAKGAELVAVKRNPIDAVWADRPEPSKARLIVHPTNMPARTAAEKRHEMADWLHQEGADAAVLAALDSIAWTFNVRGADVTHTPVALALRVVNADGTADLFVEGEKVGDDVRAHLGNGVRLHERDDFETFLRSLSGKLVAVDPERSVAAISQALNEGGARILSRRDPAVLPKAVKNPVEIAGHQAAQARDGAAVSRFLKWVEEEAPKGGLDEMIAAGQAARPARGTRRPQGPQLRHHLGVRAERRAAPLQGHRGIQPAVHARHALSGR